MNKVVGQVSHEEMCEIRQINGHIIGLEELLPNLNESNPMYNEVRSDLLDSRNRYDSWWKKMSAKYLWPSVPGGNWSINFENCEITLKVKN